MAILTTDIEFRYSNPLASSGNQLAQVVPSASLGGFLATTPWPGDSLHDLFQLLTGDENAQENVQYRCVFLINKHATLTWQAPVAWLTALNAIALDAIGVDPTPASPLTSAAAQAIIASAGTPPAGVVFSAPLSKIAGLAIGDIPAGHCKAIWFRRTATNAALGESGGVTAATNASPIVITSAVHGLVTGRQVTISGVVGNTAANGTWTVTRVDADRFSLNGTTGNGVYASGGAWNAGNLDGLSLRCEGDTA